MRGISVLVGAAAMSVAALTACEPTPAAPPAVTAAPAAKVAGAAVKSDDAAMTPDGRYVTFWSVAGGIVPGIGGTSNEQLYRTDRTTGTTIAVSVSPSGTSSEPGVSGTDITGATSTLPIGHDAADISDDGRYIVWADIASNLVPGDGPWVKHIYLRDVVAGTTTRLDTATGGVPGNGHSSTATISPNGQWIAFDSVATNLVSGEPADSIRDVYRVNRATGAIVKVSVGRAADGTATVANGNSQVPIALDDGRVVMESKASNIEKGVAHGTADTTIYLVNPGAVPVTVVSKTTGGGVGYAQLRDATGDGRYVTFTSFGNYTGKGGTVFLRDVVAGTTENALLTKDGKGGSGGDPKLSANGRYVVVYSSTSYTGEDVDGQQAVQVRDRTTGKVWIAARIGTKPGYASRVGGISSDGRKVVFNSSQAFTTPAQSGTKVWISTTTV